VLAHAVHLSDREVARLAESRARVAHCPGSNLFLAAGMMPLARYLDAGIGVGLGSDVAGGPDMSIFGAMRIGAYAQVARRAAGLDGGAVLDPLAWLRLGTLGGAAALGLGGVTGSLEPGKDADLIVVHPAVADPLQAADGPDPWNPTDPEELVSRLIFRTHPDMVRGAWVRGRRLDGPA